MVDLRQLVGMPEWEGYYAGSDGRIYSNRVAGRRGGWDPRPLKGGLDGKGNYLHVALPHPDAPSGWRSQLVHRLVCETWHGSRPELTECSHKNGNSLDNRPENLMWESLSVNRGRRVAHGTDDCGHRNSRASLSESDVSTIKAMLAKSKNLSRNERSAAGLTQLQIAEQFNVRRETISRIARGARYAR